MTDMTPDRLLSLRDVQHLVGFGRTTIYAMMHAGNFPAQRPIPGTNRVRWSEREISQWIERVLHRSAQTATIAA